MVIARQRPETANGIIFMLLEDERGAVNLDRPAPGLRPPPPLVRTAPLLRARGRLERREGTVNVLVSDLAPLEPAQPPESRPRKAREQAVAELRAVAPAGHAFGRRGR